jgi:hypothetical protein
MTEISSSSLPFSSTAIPRLLLLRAWRWSFLERTRQSLIVLNKAQQIKPIRVGFTGKELQDSYLGRLRFASKFAQLGAQDLLLLDVEILIAEENNSSLRHYKSRISVWEQLTYDLAGAAVPRQSALRPPNTYL